MTPAPRFSTLAPEAYSDAQIKAEADFRATRNAGFSAPWHVMIRSPELLTHAQRLGFYLRNHCAFSGLMAEFATLLVVRDWTQDFEWNAHKTNGLAAGLSAEMIEDIAQGRRPNVSGDLEIIWNFVTELLRTRRVSDASYAQALARFGEQGVVDLTGLVGYYSMLAMVLNVGRVGAPVGAQRLGRFPE